LKVLSFLEREEGEEKQKDEGWIEKNGCLGLLLQQANMPSSHRKHVIISS